MYIFHNIWHYRLTWIRQNSFIYYSCSFCRLANFVLQTNSFEQFNKLKIINQISFWRSSFETKEITINMFLLSKSPNTAPELTISHLQDLWMIELWLLLCLSSLYSAPTNIQSVTGLFEFPNQTPYDTHLEINNHGFLWSPVTRPADYIGHLKCNYPSIHQPPAHTVSTLHTWTWPQCMSQHTVHTISMF